MSFDPQAVAERLRAKNRVEDALFDAVFPSEIRRVSSRFWTPVDVALTAASWLQERGREAILDVGAGPGKFCIIASLVLGRTITGVEQRAALVDVGKAAAARYAARVDYIHGTIESVDATQFDAFYLFNPFGENLYSPDEYLDTEVELSALRFMHDLTIVEHWLDHAAVGTCFVTYHGFGGRVPAHYPLLRELRKGDGYLRLWEKARPGRADASRLEADAAPIESRARESQGPTRARTPSKR